MQRQRKISKQIGEVPDPIFLPTLERSQEINGAPLVTCIGHLVQAKRQLSIHHPPWGAPHGPGAAACVDLQVVGYRRTTNDHQWPSYISHPNPKRCFRGLMIIHDGIWWHMMAYDGHTWPYWATQGQWSLKITMGKWKISKLRKTRCYLTSIYLVLWCFMLLVITCSLIFQIPPATASSSMGKNRSCQGFALGNWRYLGDCARK